MPRHLVTSILLVELTTVGLIAVAVLARPLSSGDDLMRAGLLLALALAHTEGAMRVERTRRRIALPHYIDLSSVWIFAAALVLPPVLTVPIVIIVQFQIWLRTGRPRIPCYRNVFTTSTMVLAALGASLVSANISNGATFAGADIFAIVLALLCFTTINTALIAGAIAMSSPQPRLSTMVGHWDDNLLELSTLALGALVATALVINPWLVLLVLPPLLVLHRSVLVRELEQAASTDSKTGLLNAAAWHREAERELRKVTRKSDLRAVLVLDLDHFKMVNDTHGHVAGDHVLAAVADALRAEVRDQDLVGRFGGEEFVVLLAGLEHGERDLSVVAERIRRRVAGLRVEIPTADGPLTVAGLSVSVGGAVHPRDGADLRSLLQLADAALYTAKRAGRNVVRMSHDVPAKEHAVRPPLPGDVAEHTVDGQ
ncbi:GGDEF domain-containing protein [Pseudonocardia sp. TRM90224]|uniref:GGDEF domain-containing protein n=1 Tax=Pseudonocardia sp. TRM90224 TaxID=2812678 RepID=UPI001E4F0304|nr:GGDEF domain-containing protein [Pseudonocardia sp. TRM90224]